MSKAQAQIRPTTTESESNYTTFIEIASTQIVMSFIYIIFYFKMIKQTPEELNQLFKEYPPLKDSVAVEVRPIVGFEDYSTYLGEWNKHNTLKHGRGIQVWEDGTKYTGYYVNNKAHVKGKLIHSDGDVYEGEWFEGKAQGKGIYITHYDGSYYTGNWSQDKQHGYGEENWTDGSKYEGEYIFGKKTGYGKFTWSDGSMYEGQFENNLIDGKGNKIYNFIYAT